MPDVLSIATVPISGLGDRFRMQTLKLGLMFHSLIHSKIEETRMTEAGK